MTGMARDPESNESSPIWRAPMTMPSRDTTPPRRGFSQRWYWLTPLVALIVFVAVMLTLLWALRRDELDRQQQMLYREVEWAQKLMRLHLQANQDELTAMARDIGQGNLDAAQFAVLSQQ